MGRHVEPLTGGLVTDRDPAQLNKGQLSYIRNMVYKQGATSLRAAPGRYIHATAATAGGGVYGLRDMQFDNGMHYLVAGVEDMYRYMDINNPGAFSTLISGQATGKNIEAVQFRNRYYLLNGATAEASSINTNTVAYLSATATATTPSTRTHGLLPCLASPTVTTAAGTFSQSVTGYYEYWCTEVCKFNQDDVLQDLENAFSNESGPTTVYVPGNTVPTIVPPATRNQNTTHWRIYRSTKKDSSDSVKFPVGYLAAEFSTAVTGFADSTAFTVSASSFATAFNSPPSAYSQFASASSMQSSNSVYASASALAERPSSQGVYGFSFGSPRGPVRGIKVEIAAYVSYGSGPKSIDVTIGVRGNVNGNFQTVSDLNGTQLAGTRTASKTGQVVSTNPASPTIITLGGSSDPWFFKGINGLRDSDFDGNFMVVLSVGTERGSVKIGIDYVKATVYTGGAVDSTVVYPAVVYEQAGTTVQIGKNFPAPSAKTGDIFNDMLVLNDMSNPSLIRYSAPGEPDYFPPTYYLDFETKSNDVVQCIRVVNNKLIVGLDNQLWRVNYLPSERDASFDRGKAIDNISGQYGIVNPMCATTITIEGQSETLAFVSNFGLHTTDGYNIVTRSKNQTWSNYGTPKCILNDVDNRCLRIYYTNEDDSDKDLCLWASYERSDIDAEGNFKFSGPVSMANYTATPSPRYARLESAWNVTKSDGSTMFYIGYSSATSIGGGRVFTEPNDYTGTLQGYTTSHIYKTRRMFLNGFGGEWMVDDLYGYCGSYSGTPLLTYTLYGTKTNLPAGSESILTKSINLNYQRLHRVSPKFTVEGLEIMGTMTNPTTLDYGQEYVVIGSKNLGNEDSGL